MQVSMVPNDHVDVVWDSIKDYLEGAAQYTYGRYTVDDIYDCIKEYDYTLWIAFDEDKIKAAVLTNFTHYPHKKYLNMAFCGGEEINTWIEPVIKMLQCWAFDNKCDGLEATARLGWAKVFKNDGYKPLWQTFQLPAADAGLGVKHG